jgi:hypothetical protein
MAGRGRNMLSKKKENIQISFLDSIVTEVVLLCVK